MYVCICMYERIMFKKGRRENGRVHGINNIMIYGVIYYIVVFQPIYYNVYYRRKGVYKGLNCIQTKTIPVQITM